jgi:hypothetical protein
MPHLSTHVRLSGTHLTGVIMGRTLLDGCDVAYVLWEGSPHLPQAHPIGELESVEHYSKSPTPRLESTGEYDRHMQHSERLRKQMDTPLAQGTSRGHACTRR